MTPASGTFLHVPPRTEGAPADVVVLGVPYDVATHPYRVGSRMGPDHIRALSAQTRRYLADRDGDPLSALAVVDAGNVALTPGRPEPAYQAIEAAVREILDAGAVPLTFGGDGAVTLPQLRAVAARHPDLVVVHLDAHTDAYPVDPDDPYTNATTFTHAVDEKLLDPAASVHIGTRGTTSVAGVVEYARRLGYQVIPMPELRATGIAEVARGLTTALEGRPVYVCWDMDVFDPSVAPGVCTPEWGGLTAAEGIEMLRALSGLRAVAVDVNTVSPPHDPAGLTGSLAARIALEFLYSLADGR
ncbi:agmatinase [Pseudonocardia acaciae]|uniref:agmatinase n=1 Tax=Pseudonocardia acaciae TaxID=551276 RepID=UPI00048FFEEC|nr:agmatinase [Pseudonocardia acaciae]